MFTKKRKKDYLDATGTICPYCKSININAMRNIEVTVEGTATQEVECHDCGRMWKDIYTLTGVIHEDEGN